MNKNRRYISNILICFFLIIILLLIGITLYQINNAKKQIADKTLPCLETSVRKYIELKMGDAYYFATYEYDPNKRKIAGWDERYPEKRLKQKLF
jgi:hypothetical protein